MLNVAKLVAAARERASGEFENSSFEDGLGVLVDAINECPSVTPAGRDRLGGAMTDHLVRRIRIDRHLAEHPDVGDSEVPDPVFVMGMPRTGTTALINLLSQDPARRTVLRWTLEDPVPPPEAGELYTDPRCIAALGRQRAAIDEGLAGANIRFEWADSPAECVHVMNHDFKAMQWEASAPLPAYTEFLYSCDMTSAYTFHRRYLQVLQSGGPGPWALKAPSHALWIPTLLSVYPDARLIWTHRDPCTAVASLCSLVANAHRRNCAEADIDHIRNFVPVGIEEHVRRPMALLDQIGDRIHHVRYAGFVGREIETMRGLYEWMGDELTPEVESRMEQWLAERRQANLGEHRYSLEDFGLTRAELKPRFEDYVEHFRIPLDEPWR